MESSVKELGAHRPGDWELSRLCPRLRGGRGQCGRCQRGWGGWCGRRNRGVSVGGAGVAGAVLWLDGCPSELPGGSAPWRGQVHPWAHLHGWPTRRSHGLRLGPCPRPAWAERRPRQAASSSGPGCRPAAPSLAGCPCLLLPVCLSVHSVLSQPSGLDPHSLGPCCAHGVVPTGGSLQARQKSPPTPRAAVLGPPSHPEPGGMGPITASDS